MIVLLNFSLYLMLSVNSVKLSVYYMTFYDNPTHHSINIYYGSNSNILLFLGLMEAHLTLLGLMEEGDIIRSDGNA